MPSVRKEREETVAVLTKAFEDVSGLVVAEYAGVKTPELNELRAKLRPSKSEFKIVKNTLAQIALKNSKIDGFGDRFAGMSALVIQRGDAIATLKIIFDFTKEHENLKVRAGYLLGSVYKPADLKAIAALPPKPALVAKLLGQLQSPLYGLHGALSANLRNLVHAFSQVAKKKESQQPAAGGQAPATAPTA
jgi:large subunit ribosomal protein L10